MRLSEVTAYTTYPSIRPAHIVWASAAMIGIGLLTAVGWAASGNASWIRSFFGFPVSVFFLASCTVEFRCAWKAWKAFSANEPMELAWFFLVLAAACRLFGTVLAHAVVPMLPLDVALPPRILREAGLVIAGPLMMALLAAGFLVVLRVYNLLGLRGKLEGRDYFFILLSSGFALIQIYHMVLRVTDPAAHTSVYTSLLWATDPLLTVLLIQAILLWKRSTPLSGGLVARCWRAYSVAIMLTSLGDAGMLAMDYRILPWPLFAVTWYVWLPASAAFALAPAYQVAALSVAAGQKGD